LCAEGGWLSARIFPCIRPLAEIGQDEVMFHPNTMNENAWLIDGVHPMQSKGGTGGGKLFLVLKAERLGLDWN